MVPQLVELIDDVCYMMQSAPCASCGQETKLDDFPRRQKSNALHGKAALCRACSPGALLPEQLEARKKEEVAAFLYNESRGQVDGKRRKVRGSQMSVVAQPPNGRDREHSQEVKDAFFAAYDVATLSYSASLETECAALGAELERLEHSGSAWSAKVAERASLRAADERVRAMQWLEPNEAFVLTGDQLADFLSTVRGTHGTRYAMGARTETSTNHVYELAKFYDAPFMTCTHGLRFCCKAAGVQLHVTYLDPRTVVRHVEGTVIWAPGMVLVGMRLPETLSLHICERFTQVYREWRKRRPFLSRGQNCANICVWFGAMGIKNDQNSSLAMPHASAANNAHQALGVFHQLRALYRDELHPVVMRYIPSLLRPLHRLMREHDVQLYVSQVSAVTAGELFWPRSHVDNDFCFTVLVVIDIGRGPIAGGDFSFAGYGWVLELAHGDVVIYNPTKYHGTTEFKMNSPDDTRVMFAFFMSVDTVRAAVNSSVVHTRRGAR